MLRMTIKSPMHSAGKKGVPGAGWGDDAAAEDFSVETWPRDGGEAIIVTGKARASSALAWAEYRALADALARAVVARRAPLV